jgi:hypothetical protein
MAQDYIPRGDLQFLQWAINFLKYLASSMIRLGFPQNIFQELSDCCDELANNLRIAGTPSTRTKLSVQAKDTTRVKFEKMVRLRVKEYLSGNHLLTDADREGLGLHIPKSTRTAPSVAASYPATYVDSTVLRRVTVHYHDKENGAKAKPAGQIGVEIKWVILDVKPVSLNELINSTFHTRTPFTMEFDENQRGKTVYFCLCWVNTRGVKGPYSQISSAIIP